MLMCKTTWNFDFMVHKLRWYGLIRNRLKNTHTAAKNLWFLQDERDFISINKIDKMERILSPVITHVRREKSDAQQGFWGTNGYVRSDNNQNINMGPLLVSQRFDAVAILSVNEQHSCHWKLCSHWRRKVLRQRHVSVAIQGPVDCQWTHPIPQSHSQSPPATSVGWVRESRWGWGSGLGASS